MQVKISGFYDEVSSDLDKQIALIKELGEEGIPLDYFKKDTTNLIRRLKNRKK